MRPVVTAATAVVMTQAAIRTLLLWRKAFRSAGPRLLLWQLMLRCQEEASLTLVTAPASLNPPALNSSTRRWRLLEGRAARTFTALRAAQQTAAITKKRPAHCTEAKQNQSVGCSKSRTNIVRSDVCACQRYRHDSTNNISRHNESPQNRRSVWNISVDGTQPISCNLPYLFHSHPPFEGPSPLFFDFILRGT